MTSAKSVGARCNAATVQQFPIIVSFSSTTQKIQGQTIIKPRKAAIDLRSVFGANQAYVMMGRVQQLEQLFIIDSLPENKIYADKKALDQLEIMKNKSLNNNRPDWEKKQTNSIRIYFHNIQSLMDKIDDIKADDIPFFADVLIFAETWLDESICNTATELTLGNYSLNLNSMGRGKGLAVYYDVSRFQVTKQIGENNYQLTKIESGTFTVIALYRSQGEFNFLDQLMENIPETGDCLMIGDLNICSKKQQHYEIFKNLRTKEFKLLIKEATHMKGGHIDQV